MFGCPIRGYQQLLVTQRQSLVSFLQNNGYPGSRARILLGCARIYLVPLGQGRVPLSERDANLPVGEGDKICIPVVLSETCRRKIDTAPGTEILIGGNTILQEIERALRSAERYIYISAWELDPDVPMPLSGRTFEQLLREEVLPYHEGLRVYILWNRRLPLAGPEEKEFLLRKGKVFTAEELREKTMRMIGDRFIDRVQVVGGLREEFTWEYKPASIAEFIGRGLVQEFVEWLVLGSHHTKSLVVDGRVAFCGSADLVHRVSSGACHEVTARVTGPAARAIEEDFVDRWNREREEHSVIPYKEFAGIPVVVADRLTVQRPESEPTPRKERKVITVCRTDPGSKKLQRRWEIDRAIRALVLDAKERIYIENQYFREPNIAKLLRAWVTKSADRKLTILVTDAAEELALVDEEGNRVGIEELDWQDLSIHQQLMVFGEVETIRLLTTEEDDDGYVAIDNVRILSLSPDITPRPYIHSKVLIVDPHLPKGKLLVGSANLNPRGLNGRVDYELAVLIEDPEVVQNTYQALMDRFFEGESAFKELPASVVENRYRHHRRIYGQALTEILEGRSFIHRQYEKFGFLL